MGKRSRLSMASLRALVSSSAVRSPFSKYFSMSSSSAAAASSTRAMRISSALSANSAGMSASEYLPSVKVYILLATMSTTWLNPRPGLVGNWRTVHLEPKKSLSWLTLSSKLAFSASRWLTTKSMGVSSFAA